METFSMSRKEVPRAYVLEGQIVMQLKGQPAVTLQAGQTFYEGPADVHVVGRNASNTEPARFVVVLLKAKGAPILVPVEGLWGLCTVAANVRRTRRQDGCHRRGAHSILRSLPLV